MFKRESFRTGEVKQLTEAELRAELENTYGGPMGELVDGAVWLLQDCPGERLVQTADAVYWWEA